MTSYRHLKIIVGLVLIFAAGAVTGSIVTHQMIKRAFVKSLRFENWTAGAVAHIEKKLNLTADQKPKVRLIMEDTGKQLQSVFSKTMKESGQILVQSGKQLDQVLTPEQRAIHNEMKAQMRAALKKHLNMDLPEE